MALANKKFWLGDENLQRHKRGTVNIVQNLYKFIMQMKEATVREAWAPEGGPDFAGLLADNF